MGWRDAANSEGAGQSEKLVAGVQDLKIVKVVFGSKNDGYFTTKKGDRQIMLVYADDQDREGSQMYTLSGPAQFALAKVLEAAGADLDKMDRDGIGIDKFAEERFAQANLVGRSLRADVELDGKYFKITPLRKPTTVSVGAGEDDIPI